MPPRLLVLLAALSVFGLAACGSDDGTASDSGGTSTSATPTSPTPTSATPTSSAPASSGSGTCDYPSDPSGTAARQVSPPPSTPDVSGQVTATLGTSIGPLTFTLDADSAPCTVNNFVSLAKQGYFDKTTCHRLTEGDQTGIAVLQCGDPTGTGTGGPGYTIPDELTGNTGDYPPGTLAMANTGQPDSGGSQFFIVYGASQLGPLYSIFGTVDSAGLAAIEKVAQGGTDNSFGQGDGAPKTPVDITTVTVG